MNTIHYTTKTRDYNYGYDKNDNIMRNRMDSSDDKDNIDREKGRDMDDDSYSSND